MWRTALSIAFLAFALGTGAVAQPAVSVRANAGAAFFQSPEGLNNVLNSGVDLGLGAGVELYRGLELVLEGGYDRFTLNGDNLALLDETLSVETADIEGGALNVFSGTLGLRYTVQATGDVRPYASGGVGLYHSVLERIDVPQREDPSSRLSATRQGYHAALGSKFRINSTYSFFFEPRYVIVDTRGSELDTRTSTRYVTVRVGVDVRL